METKLKFNHIVPYLPYKLMVFLEKKQYVLTGLSSPYKTNNNFFIQGEVKPINAGYKEIRSMCLTKETLSFLKLILRPLPDLVGDEDEFHKITGIVTSCEMYCDMYNEWHDNFISEKPFEKILQAPYEVIQKLFEQQYDVFNLIPAGLAINIYEL